METMRRRPPEQIGDFQLMQVRDYRLHEIRSLPGNERIAELPEPSGDLLIAEGASNGCQIRIAVRPSGTEPKIKCYLFAQQPVSGDAARARGAAGGELRGDGRRLVGAGVPPAARERHQSRARGDASHEEGGFRSHPQYRFAVRQTADRQSDSVEHLPSGDRRLMLYKSTRPEASDCGKSARLSSPNKSKNRSVVPYVCERLGRLRVSNCNKSRRTS